VRNRSSLCGGRVSPHEYCQQKAAQSGSSFYYSFLFLPEERRRAITALYAFCREVDDAVDEIKDVGVARTDQRIGTPTCIIWYHRHNNLPDNSR